MKRQLAALLYSGVLFAAAGLSAAPSVPIYTSVKDLMQSFIDPSADAIWNAVGTVVDEEHGIQELAPKTDEEWVDVRRATIRLIEGGNLLMMPNRAAAPPGTRSDTPGVELEPEEIAVLINNNRRAFDTFAKELQSLGAEALRAAEQKDPNSLIEIGARMENVCESCHQTFWYPPKSAPQSGRR